MASGRNKKAWAVILMTAMLLSGFGGISSLAGAPDNTAIKEKPLFSDITDAAFDGRYIPIPLSPGPGPMPMTVLLSENFSAPWVFGLDSDYHLGPPGWDVDGISTRYWAQFDDAIVTFPISNSTPYSAGVWWSANDPAQDEWLISPPLDLSTSMDTKLYFNSIYTMPSYGADPTARDLIEVSTDGGASWTILGDLAHDAQFEIPGATGGSGGAGWCWYEMWNAGQTWGPIDLSAYDFMPSVTICFHYDIPNTAVEYGIWCVDDVHVEGTYAPSPPPVADAGPDQAVLNGEFVTFNGSDSYDPENDVPPNRGIINWTWTFTDGGPQTIYGKNPMWFFFTSGTYMVTLTVKDSTNQTDTDTMNVTVNDYFNIPITDSALSGGWILLSFPNKISGHPFDVVIDARNDGGGLVQWDIIQHYNSTTGKWETSAKFWPPSLNTFTYVDNKMGFWLHISNVGDGNLTIAGPLPATGEVINMTTFTGWNLIGWPGYTTPMIDFIGGSWSDVEVYDPYSPYYIRETDIFVEYFEPGHGYWVYGLWYDISSITIP